MKKILVLYALLVTLIFGTASPAFAAHCDVQKGDSMWRIAKRYHVLFSEVLRLNQHFKNQDMIHPEDEVQLPYGNTGHRTNEDSSKDNIESGKEESKESGTSEQAKEVLQLVNQERSKQGLRALTLSNELTSIATTKARDMAESRYFDHNSPNYGSPFEMLQKFGVNYRSAGENIAAGQRTAKEVMNSWMNSSGHRANILNANYTQLGVGFYAGGQYDTYWVQLFIKP